MELAVVVVMIYTMIVMMMQLAWLHFEHKFSTFNEGILRIENATIAIKSTAKLVPARLIKEVEIVMPSQIKLLCLSVPII